MATKVNPTPETGTTEDAPQAATAAASSGTVRVQWNGWKALKGVNQRRTIGNHTWISDGWTDPEPVDMDAAAWAELTPAQRKADGFEEV